MTSPSKEVKVPGNHSSMIPLKIKKLIFSDILIVTDLMGQGVLFCFYNDRKKSL